MGASVNGNPWQFNLMEEDRVFYGSYLPPGSGLPPCAL